MVVGVFGVEDGFWVVWFECLGLCVVDSVFEGDEVGWGLVFVSVDGGLSSYAGEGFVDDPAGRVFLG